MALSKYLEELQALIAKFMDIHTNPHDTSKHNETATKLEEIQKAIDAAANSVTVPKPVPAKSTNELGLTEAQVTDKLNNFLAAFDKITVIVGGQPIAVEVPYHINNDPNLSKGWDGTNMYAGKGTPKELQDWLQNEINTGKTKAKDATALNVYMKSNKMGVDCSGFVSQALNFLADKEGDTDYGSDDPLKPDGTGSGNLKGGAKDFKKIEPANIKAGDTLFYDNKAGVDHIQIVADTRKEGDILYFTIFESASGGPRKMDWKYEGGKLYRKDGTKWTVKTNESFGRWSKLEEKIPSGGDVVVDNPVKNNGNSEPVSTVLSGSVGEGGDNKEADVRLIQGLLNKKGANPQLLVDGDCGKKSVTAIKAFQSSIGQQNPDGLISPGKSTWQALNGNAPVTTTPTTPTKTTKPTNSPVVAGDDTPKTGAVPANFVRMKDSDVTPALSKAAVNYLNVFTKKYPAAVRQQHYGEYIIFKTEDGKEYLAHFEVHTVYGADPSKPKVPHPSIGLFKNKNNDTVVSTPVTNGGSILDTISDAVSGVIDTVVDTVVDFVTDVISGGTTIKASVGEGGQNDVADVKIIQDLLNTNGANPKLLADGDCGKKTITAIKAFQSKIGQQNPDGLISPGRSTWQALTKGTTTTPTDTTTTTPTNTSTPTPNTGGNQQPIDEALSTTSKITASVGNKGVNKPEDVVLVKKLLNKFGYNLELTPDSNNQLIEAIKKFQQDFRGSANPDGKVDAGGATWNNLLGIGRIKGDLVKTSQKYGVDPAVILAIQSIESGGNGFLSDGRPKILFEGHVFWRQLKAAGKDPIVLSKGNEDILYPSFDKSKYIGGAAEYDRLERAKKMDKIAALKSASWGEFQIMGFNHAVVGYADVESFVEGMHQAGSNQLNGVMEFLKNNNLIRHVSGTNKNWTALAEGYNGKGQQGYDTKLEKAYARFSKITL